MAGPTRASAVKVRVAIKVEQSNLDSAVDRLRISGIIIDTDNEMVPKGTHHSLSVHTGDMATIDKGRRWQDVELEDVKAICQQLQLYTGSN